MLRAEDSTESAQAHHDILGEYRTKWLFIVIILNLVLSIELGWLYFVLIADPYGSYSTIATGIIFLVIFVVLFGVILYFMDMVVWLSLLVVNAISLVSLISVIFYRIRDIDAGAILPDSVIAMLIPSILGIITAVVIIMLLISPQIRKVIFRN